LRATAFTFAAILTITAAPRMIRPRSVNGAWKTETAAEQKLFWFGSARAEPQPLPPPLVVLRSAAPPRHGGAAISRMAGRTNYRAKLRRCV